jgi:hypothetical protein
MPNIHAISNQPHIPTALPHISDKKFSESKYQMCNDVSNHTQLTFANAYLATILDLQYRLSSGHCTEHECIQKLSAMRYISPFMLQIKQSKYTDYERIPAFAWLDQLGD